MTHAVNGYVTVPPFDFICPISKHFNFLHPHYTDKFIFPGFLAQLVMGRPLETCIRCGIWAATEIIQCSGCTCEGQATFSE